MNLDIPIKIFSDTKGYYDRQCPNTDCLFDFKINMDDWKNKIKNHVYCPMCGIQADSEQWYTEKQIESIEKIAEYKVMEYVSDTLDKTFRTIENEFKNNKFIQIKYKPDKPITLDNNPILSCEEWNLDLKCEECNTRYSVIGASYFCPCCGAKPSENIFFTELEILKKQISSIEKYKVKCMDDFNVDESEIIYKSLIESSIGKTISLFQKYAQTKLYKISGKDYRVNDFQKVKEGSNHFQQHTGKGYDTWISENELSFLKMMFQKRHVLEHNMGYVDNDYIQRSGDSTYSIGQRLVIHIEDVIRFIDVILKLSTGIKSLQ